MKRITFILVAALTTACSSIEEPHYVITFNNVSKYASADIISQQHSALLYHKDTERSNYVEKQKVTFELSAESICHETAEIYHQKKVLFWRQTYRLQEFTIKPSLTLVNCEVVNFPKAGVSFHHPDFPTEGSKEYDLAISSHYFDDAYCEIKENVFLITIAVADADGHLSLEIPIIN